MRDDSGRIGCLLVLLVLVALFCVAAIFAVVPYKAACDVVRDVTDRQAGWCRR